jgi:hypothetical protein
MGKKLAAGDVDIDIDSLVQDASDTPTNIEYTPMGEGFVKAFAKKKKGGEEGMRSEAAKRLMGGSSDNEVSESFDKKIKSGKLPEIGE